MTISLRNIGTVNKNLVILGPLTVWFSYETPVSYRVDGQAQVTRENDWSKTTGKLLNECEPDKTKRIPGERFEAQLNALLSKIQSSI